MECLLVYIISSEFESLCRICNIYTLTGKTLFFKTYSQTITKTSLFKYIENFTTKKKNKKKKKQKKKNRKFSDKNSDIFHSSVLKGIKII